MWTGVVMEMGRRGGCGLKGAMSLLSSPHRVFMLPWQ